MGKLAQAEAEKRKSAIIAVILWIMVITPEAGNSPWGDRLVKHGRAPEDRSPPRP
jgi:hypothetical protein